MNMPNNFPIFFFFIIMTFLLVMMLYSITCKSFSVTIWFIKSKLEYCLTRKTLRCNSLVQKICISLQKDISHRRSSSALGLRGSKYYIFGNQLYLKNVKKLRCHVFLNFHARKHISS